MDIYIPTIELPTFNALQKTAETVNRIQDQLNISGKIEQLVQTITLVNTKALEIDRAINRMLPHFVSIHPRPDSVSVPQTKKKLHADKPQLYHAQVDGITYLMAGGERPIRITKATNKPSKALEYIVDHIGEATDYIHFYNLTTDPERGRYSALWHPISDIERVRRARATLNQLYTFKGFSDLLTIHFKGDHFYVTQKK